MFGALTCNALVSSFAASIAGGASYLSRRARQFSLLHLEQYKVKYFYMKILQPGYLTLI